MRTIIVLLQIVIDSLKKGEKIGYYNYGICGEITDLLSDDLITPTEAEILKRYVHEHKPSEANLFKKYTKGKFWYGDAFWWVCMADEPKTRAVRIRFLKELQTLEATKVK